MNLARGDKRKHFVPAPHPAIDATFQHRAALSRAEPFAVHHPDAGLTAICAVAYELVQVLVCLFERHAVQVNFALDRVAPPRQLPHLTFADTRAREAQVLDVVHFKIVDVSLQAFCECRALIRARKTRPRFQFSRRWRYSLFALQWFSIRHCTLKQV